MKWTEDKLDILQNLEFAVLEVWRANRDMSDYAALRAYEAAFQFYRAESRGHTAKPPELKGHDATAFEGLKAMCEFRLGRADCPISGPKRIPPISLDLLLACLRELGKSVERHTKSGGRQGYLTFINRYFP
ncbi:MAG: hypothetical protein H0X66_05455 [Verrucomicrobia bacterium]|nr:hypothetical protein [Verrucomicrobiota bacterium]